MNKPEGFSFGDGGYVIPFAGSNVIANVKLTVEEEPARDETFIGRMVRIDDFCRRGDVDIRPLRDEVEHVLDAAKALHDAAADMNQRQRRVVADALGTGIREVME